MEEGSNGELAFLKTLLNNGRYLYWYLGSLRILTNTTALTTKQVERKMFSSFLCNRAYSIINNKHDLIKENAEIKKVLKDDRYREGTMSKIFKRFTNNHSLSQSQQQTQVINIQEQEIRINISLPYVESFSEKLRRLLRSHKIRSNF